MCVSADLAALLDVGNPSLGFERFPETTSLQVF